MRVGIDATALLVPKQTGIQRYTTSLILAMIEILPEYSDLELYLYFHIADRHVDAKLLPTFRHQLNKAKVRTWEFPRAYRLALPLMAQFDKLDLLHFPDPHAVRIRTCPILITVHDLCWRRLPSDDIPIEIKSGKSIIEKAIRQASAYIAVSHSTCIDLIEAFEIDPDCVKVIYEGADTKFRPERENAEAFRHKYGLDRYFLYVGTIQQRKNLVRLLEAYSKLLTKHRVTQKLVIVGSEGWGYEDVYSSADQLGLGKHVFFLGYVPDEDLPAFYTFADLFIFPSLCEGFGLPVLEAMACGTPVVIAETSSLPEVAGDAAQFFNPYDTDDLSEKILEVINDPIRRADLVRKGRNQARQFRWKKAAQNSIIFYRELCNGSRQTNDLAS